MPAIYSNIFKHRNNTGWRATSVLIGSTLLASCLAQDNLVAPPAAALSNYERVPIGDFGAIEGGSIIARTRGSEATWYNPAGLVSAKDDTVSANTSIFEVDTLTTDTEQQETEDTNVDQIPSFVGTNIIFRADEDSPLPTMAIGLALTSPIQWRQTADFQETQVNSDNSITTASRNVFINYSLVTGGIGFSTTISPTLRWGVTAWLGRTTYDSIRSFSTRQRASGGSPLNTETSSTAIRSTAWHGRIGIGLQWDFHPKWTLGLHARSPSLQVFDSARISFDSFSNDGSNAVDRTMATEGELFTYLPTEFGAGLAFHNKTFQMEAVIRVYGESSTYDLIEANQDILVVDTDLGTNTTTNSTTPFPTVSTRAKTTINAGLAFRWWFHRNFSLHGSWGRNNSPTSKADDPAFKPIDLQHVSLSMARHGTNLTTALGLRYSWGSDDGAIARNIINGEDINSQFSLSTFSLLVATRFRF